MEIWRGGGGLHGGRFGRERLVLHRDVARAIAVLTRAALVDGRDRVKAARCAAASAVGVGGRALRAHFTCRVEHVRERHLRTRDHVHSESAIGDRQGVRWGRGPIRRDGRVRAWYRSRAPRMVCAAHTLSM